MSATGIHRQAKKPVRSRARRGKTWMRSLAGENVPDAALIAAIEHCLWKYGTSYAPRAPRKLPLRKREVWLFPVALTSPGIETVGEVGVIAVDVETHKVVGATSREEVRAAGTRLYQEYGAEMEAAFLRVRQCASN